jgi:lipid-A-disaccharide synthase
MACFKETHRQYGEAYLRRHDVSGIELCVGRTPEIIHLAQACVAVSGSVGLELLYHGTPSIVLYRIGRLDLKVCRYFMTSRYISLVNLLADREVFPEFLTDRCEAVPIAEHVLRWLNDPTAAAAARAELAALRRRVAEPGACDRAARFMLQTLRQPMPLAA